MAVTVSLVKKLILEHIGGQKIKGNPSNVLIAGKRVVIQAKGLVSSLTGIVGEIANVGDVVSALVQNPLGAITDTITSKIGDVLGAVQGLGLPTDLLNSATSALSTLTSTVSDLKLHTDILSGVVTDVEQITGLGKATFGDLMQLTNTDDIYALGGSLFKDQAVDAIRKSLDITVPGGVTDIIATMAATDPTDTVALTQLTDTLTKAVSDHTVELNTMVQDDAAAYTAFTLNQDVNHSVNSMIPAVENELFNLVATPQLQQLISVIPEDEEETGLAVDTNDGRLAVSYQAMQTHTHRAADITDLLQWLEENYPHTDSGTANSTWGAITGDIEDQADLVDYIAAYVADHGGGGGGGGTWGSITGTLSDQTDLIAVLNDKANLSDLAIYVDPTELSANLANYSNTAVLAAGYVDNGELAANLANYTNTAVLITTLGGYAALGGNNTFTGANNTFNANVNVVGQLSSGSGHFIANTTGVYIDRPLAVTNTAALGNTTVTGFVVINTTNFVANSSVLQTDRPVTITNTLAVGNTNVSGWLTVTDDAYDATTWNGSTQVPTKNAIRDKIESLSGPSIRAITATDNALTTDYCILANTNSGNVVVNLFAVASNSGRRLNIKKTDNSNNIVTVDANTSETIDGSTTYVLSNQYEAVTIICDGSTWWIE
jgi:hypothetical protein